MDMKITVLLAVVMLVQICSARSPPKDAWPGPNALQQAAMNRMMKKPKMQPNQNMLGPMQPSKPMFPPVSPFGMGSGLPFGMGSGSPFGMGSGSPFGMGSGMNLPNGMNLPSGMNLPGMNLPSGMNPSNPNSLNSMRSSSMMWPMMMATNLVEEEMWPYLWMSMQNQQ